MVTSLLVTFPETSNRLEAPQIIQELPIETVVEVVKLPYDMAVLIWPPELPVAQLVTCKKPKLPIGHVPEDGATSNRNGGLPALPIELPIGHVDWLDMRNFQSDGKVVGKVKNFHSDSARQNFRSCA